MRKQKKYGIETDGRTVWVNGDIGCIGRFCPISIEIFTGDRCIGEPHPTGKTNRGSWSEFQRLMKKHHGIAVPNEYMPDFLR